ncbi:nitrite reductase (NADH) large subunit [Methylacidimicrobium cyclopophantes]|uniref:Nitrite reductase (NADH) large subunit n=1 Tax=Methylacidimicrobium cyclopophantes TaxID=1041766 RepID=A0A5E6MGR6_9BACT|nr:nitrite reductase large subunit NirB [Methylacidimicrobium cyclopophantes]VVM08472.1 nitrite reductase (NADH) large subunit [Methylacidimicrobium cyclopophantes]
MRNGSQQGPRFRPKRPRLVVVGAGMAAARLLEEMQSVGGLEAWEVTLIGEEPSGAYNRILLSTLLEKGQKPETILLQTPEWYRQNGIRARLGRPAERIDRNQRLVFTAEGAFPYDRLVLSTGSQPILPPITGLVERGGGLRPGAFVFRSIQDCERILAAAPDVQRAVVIGGGLLGLEAAHGLLAHRMEVHLVHREGHLMEQQLDPTAGAILQGVLERKGLRIHLGAQSQAILGTEERVAAIRLADGSTLPADLVIVATGIRPNVALAQACGLPVRRGILVDDQLRSPGDPNVHALGECAEHAGRVYGLVAPAWEQAKVLADLLTSRNPEARYQGSRIATHLKVSGVHLTVMGKKDPSEPEEVVVQYSEPQAGIYKKLVLRENRLVGAIVLGDDSKGAELLGLFDLQIPLPPIPTLLFPSSSSSLAAAASDDRKVCFCHSVSQKAIRQAVESGCRTLRSLCERTRASTGCGSCKPEVEKLFREFLGAAPEEDPKAHYYVPGVPLAKSELVAEIRRRKLRSVSAVFRELAGGREDGASKPGIASLLKSLWKDQYEDERDARHINDRVHANVQKDNTYSVVPRIYGGIVTPSELRRIADVAERYRVPMVKITGGQRIDLLGVSRELLPAVWRDLGMPSGHAYTKAFRTCKTCVGSEFCRFGLGDSTALGIALEKRFQGLETPAKVKMAVSGCPRNCAEATTKDLGVVAIESGWQIYVGGAAGSRVRAADLLTTVSDPKDVVRIAGRFLAYYQANARYAERSYLFTERIGVKRLQALLVEDAEGEAQALDREIEAAVASYRDPWQEGKKPIEPRQFQSSTPLPLAEESR